MPYLYSVDSNPNVLLCNAGFLPVTDANQKYFTPQNQSTSLHSSLTQPSSASKFQEVKRDRESLSPNCSASFAHWCGSCVRRQKHGAGREGPDSADEQ